MSWIVINFILNHLLFVVAVYACALWLYVIPWTVAHQAPLSTEFSRQYWISLLFPTPEDLPDPGIKPPSLGRFFGKPLGKPLLLFHCSVLSLCDPKNCSTPGSTIFHCLPEFAQVHVGYPPISTSVTLFSSCLQYFPASGSFPMSRLFPSVAKGLKLQL